MSGANDLTPVQEAARRHADDPYAHPAMVNRLMMELEGRRVERDREVDDALKANDGRLSRLERFQFMVAGGLVTISAALAGGIITLILHATGWAR